MPRNDLVSIRKKSLVNSTISEIGRTGSLDVTVSQIARNSGVSSALAHHYFGSKEQIFLAAMRHIMSEFGKNVSFETKQVTKPREKLEAIIRACFEIDNFTDEVISAWLNFYVKAQNSPDVRRLLRIYQHRMRSNFIYYLKPIVGNEAADIASGLGAMIDGHYIRQALRETKPDPARAISLVTNYLDLRISVRTKH